MIFFIKWGLGIGDWGLGIGDWANPPIPNPQSPIPNPHITINCKQYLKYKYKQLFNSLNKYS